MVTIAARFPANDYHELVDAITEASMQIAAANDIDILDPATRAEVTALAWGHLLSALARNPAVTGYTVAATPDWAALGATWSPVVNQWIWRHDECDDGSLWNAAIVHRRTGDIAVFIAVGVVYDFPDEQAAWQWVHDCHAAVFNTWQKLGATWHEGNRRWEWFNRTGDVVAAAHHLHGDDWRIYLDDLPPGDDTMSGPSIALRKWIHDCQAAALPDTTP